MYLSLHAVRVDDIQFMETKPNIIMDGAFTKLIYSNAYFSLNSVYINIPLVFTYYYKNTSSAGGGCTAFFDKTYEKNKETIEKLIELEKQILIYYKEVYYKQQYKSFHAIQQQLNNGFFKTYAQIDAAAAATANCIIKISGVWENKTTVGLTFKFFVIPAPSP